MKKTALLIILTTVSLSAMEEHQRIEELAARTAAHRKKAALIYEKWYGKPLRQPLTASKLASEIRAYRWAKNARSKKDIVPFIQKYNIAIDEFVDPVDSFKTFNEFFIRKLKPGARPLSQELHAITSPADGAVLVMKNIGAHTVFPSPKVVHLSLEKMLKSPALAKEFEGGTAFVVRLAEWDYHRFHFPLSGIPGAPRYIKGRYESVSPIAYEYGKQPLEVNKREIFTMQTDTASTMAIVLVGALFIGSIVTTYTPGTWVAQGAEMGYFEFGGSTMVLLFKKDTIRVLPQILKNSAQAIETPVKMGELIGQVIAPAPRTINQRK